MYIYMYIYMYVYIYIGGRVDIAVRYGAETVAN